MRLPLRDLREVGGRHKIIGYTIINEETGERDPLTAPVLSFWAADSYMSVGTQGQYASRIAAFRTWMSSGGRDLDLVAAAQKLHVYRRHLQTTATTRAGRGQGKPVGKSAEKGHLAAIRSYYTVAVTLGLVDRDVVKSLWVTDDRAEVRVRPVHQVRGVNRNKLQQPKAAPTGAYDRCMELANTARDRLMLALYRRLGQRVGQVCGIRRQDVHLTDDPARFGMIDPATEDDPNPRLCQITQPHVHIIRRENPNEDYSKSPYANTLPILAEEMELFAAYYVERRECRAAWDNDMLFVNLSGEHAGRAMTSDNARGRLESIAKRAGYERLTPHMFRHELGADWIDAGGSPSTLQKQFGQASLRSTEVYINPTVEQMTETAKKVHARIAEQRPKA